MARLNTVKSFRGTSKTSDGLLTCGRCQEKIKVGDPYKWWANRLPGSRGGTKRIRCAKPACHPRPSDITPGRLGQFYALGENLSDGLDAWVKSEPDSVDDIESLLEDAAEGVRELAAEYQESADNIEQGFGHSTYQSDELAEKAQELESAADEVANVDFDDPPEREDYEDDDEYEQARQNWMEDCTSRASGALDEVPM